MYLSRLSPSVAQKPLNPRLQRVDPEKINFDLVAQVVRHIHCQAPGAEWLSGAERLPGGISGCRLSRVGLAVQMLPTPG